MTITYGELKGRVLRVLDAYEVGGEEDSGSVNEPSILDAALAAHDAILPWLPKKAVATLAADSVSVFTLPTDFYEMEAVVDSQTGRIYPKVLLDIDSIIGENSSGENDWMLFPSGSMTFSKAPQYDITLYYLASWAKLEDPGDDDALEPPDFAMNGMTLYASAMVMLSGAVSITEIKQFATKVDSGHPEHNPMMRAVNYLLKLFAAEMNRHPKHVRMQQ